MEYITSLQAADKWNLSKRQVNALCKSKGCDSRELFSDLEISRDATFEKYLNHYDVIYLDITL